MSASNIEWTESTWNPSTGCTKLSAGCRECYAAVMARRLNAMGTPGYEDGFAFREHASRVNGPRKVRKPTVFFVNSMSDLFHEKATEEHLDAVFATIRATPRHTYQILTKRPHLMAAYFRTRDVPLNAWIGTSIENKRTKFRLDELRQIRAKTRFLSCEPLLESIGKLVLNGIHWVIVGGESGAKARAMKTEWAEDIRDQCRAQRVAFFFKQWGTFGVDGVRRSKKLNGRELAGRQWNEYPNMLGSKQQ